MMTCLKISLHKNQHFDLLWGGAAAPSPPFRILWFRARNPLPQFILAEISKVLQTAPQIALQFEWNLLRRMKLQS